MQVTFTLVFIFITMLVHGILLVISASELGFTFRSHFCLLHACILNLACSFSLSSLRVYLCLDSLINLVFFYLYCCSVLTPVFQSIQTATSSSDFQRGWQVLQHDLHCFLTATSYSDFQRGWQVLQHDLH